MEETGLNIGTGVTIPADNVRGRAAGDDRGKGVIAGGQLLRQGEKIYDLVDVYDDQDNIELGEDLQGIVVAGQSNERRLGPNDKIFDLVDVVATLCVIVVADADLPNDKIFDLVDVVENVAEEGVGVTFPYSGLREEIVEMVSHIAEKIAREIIPDIAERAIKKEIEKLKKGNDYGK